MDVPTLVGQNIARIRAAKGLSQNELVARIDPSKLHIGQGYLSKIEAGKKNISIVTLAIIAEALQVTMNDLVNDSRST